MKQFVFRSIIFVSLVVVLLVLLELYFTSQLKKSTDHRFVVWNEITQGNIEADVLIMGSSRAWVQYSPSILDSILNVNSYNLGIDGSCFNRQIERYNVYRMYNNKPSIIIQDIGVWATLNYTTGYQREQYFPYFYNPEMMQYFKEPFSDSERLPFIRYCGHRDLILDILFDRENDIKRYKGYLSRDKSYDGSRLGTIDSIIFQYDSRTKQMFLDYIAQAKEDSIQLVFVYAPFYIEAISKVINLDLVYDTFDSIAYEYNIPILDYTFSAISYDTTYFYNAMHLNKRGSELFSTKLANDLDSLNIIH